MKLRWACVGGVVILLSSFAVRASAISICNEMIHHSIVLTVDVGSSGSPCTAPGLQIAASGITVDLNHHTVWGNSTGATDYGIEFLSGVHDVTLKNGTVRGFGKGLDSSNNKNLTISRMVLTNNQIGTYLIGARGLNLQHNVATHNAVAGFEVTLGVKAHIRHNVASANGGGFGVDVTRGDFTDNVSSNNGGDGADVSAFHGLVSGNLAVGNTGDGIEIENGFVQVKNNQSIDNTDTGFHAPLAERDVFKRNRAIGNQTAGFVFVGKHVTVEHNSAQGNDADGIDLQGDHGTIANNRVEANGNFGMHVDGDGEHVDANHLTGNYDNGIEFATTAHAEASRNVLIGNGFKTGVFDGTVPGLDTHGAVVVGGHNVGNANNGPGCNDLSLCTHPTTSFPLTTFGCGDSVDHSVRLQADVGSGTPCVLDGLDVTADNITIDLNGFAVLGNATHNGGTNSDIGINIGAHKGVKVLNGRVHGFDYGVEKTQIAAGTGRGPTVNGVVADDNADDGILADGKDVMVTSNAVVGSNTFEAIGVLGSGVVRNNVVVGGATRGFLIESSGPVSRNVVRSVGGKGIETVVGHITDNTIVNPGDIGIKGFDSKLTKNVVVKAGHGTSSFDGIFEDGAGVGSSVVSSNIVTRSGGVGFELADDKTVANKNLAAKNGTGGVELSGSDSRLTHSTVVGNGLDGVGLFGANDSVRSDRIYDSHDDGVHMVGGGGHITDDDASGNGNDGVHIDPALTAVVDHVRLAGDGFRTGTGYGLEAPPSGVTGTNTAYGDAHDPPCTPTTLC
jgi:hypothetical protein